LPARSAVLNGPPEQGHFGPARARADPLADRPCWSEVLSRPRMNQCRVRDASSSLAAELEMQVQILLAAEFNTLDLD
jgi:hypothetical protein